MGAMPKGYPFVQCRRCGAQAPSRWWLSLSGLCPDCGPEIQREEIHQLIAHTGPHFDHWRRQCLAAFGVTLPPSSTDTEGIA